jgi:hypothetical protein|tara:strand:- start:724 stop:1995 length:1272 start_codon:yes stop_codon:yes gene_type:complete
MATCIYTGGATIVQDEVRLTPGGTIEIGDEFRITIGTKTVQFIATATTVANVTAGLLAAITAADYAEFDEITWSDQATYLKGLGSATTGRPTSDGISVATTESGGGAADAQTFTKTVTTRGTGPNDYTNTDNWDGDALPTTGDTVYLGSYGYMPQYGLGQTAVTLAALHILSGGYSGLQVGLPRYNTTGGFAEHLPTHLDICATLVYIGAGNGTYTPSVNLDLGIEPSTVQVLKSGSRNSDGSAPIQILCDDVATVITDNRGAVDVANFAGESSTLATIQNAAGGDLIVGDNVTVATVTVSGGSVTYNSANAPTTVTVRNGARLNMNGTGGTVTTFTNQPGAIVYWSRTGTVTTTVNAGSIYLGQDVRTGKTFTNLDVYSGAVWDDPNSVVTYTNGCDLNSCSLSQVTLNFGSNRRITPGTVA